MGWKMTKEAALKRQKAERLFEEGFGPLILMDGLLALSKRKIIHTFLPQILEPIEMLPEATQLK